MTKIVKWMIYHSNFGRSFFFFGFNSCLSVRGYMYLLYSICAWKSIHIPDDTGQWDQSENIHRHETDIYIRFGYIAAYSVLFRQAMGCICTVQVNYIPTDTKIRSFTSLNHTAKRQSSWLVIKIVYSKSEQFYIYLVLIIRLCQPDYDFVMRLCAFAYVCTGYVQLRVILCCRNPPGPKKKKKKVYM